MSKSLNKVSLIGTVGKDPEVKVTPSGVVISEFSLATNERFKDKAGEWQDKTEWHNIVTFAKTAEIVRDYVKKGSKLYLEGSIGTESWDDKETGKKVYRTKIKVNDVILLSAKDSNGSSNGSSNGTSETAAPAKATAASSKAVSAPPSDDDIPF